MIRTIEKLIQANHQIHDYKIMQIVSTKHEGYFIKRDIEMTRMVETKAYDVTLYLEDKVKDQPIIRQVSFTLEEAVTQDEIKAAIDNAVYKAQYVQVKHFAPVEGDKVEHTSHASGFQEYPLVDYLALAAKAIFAADHYEEGFINSCEIFMEERTIHLINSKGVNHTHKSRSLGIECIVTWGKGHQEVELYNFLHFPTWNENAITKEVEIQFTRTRDRHQATYTPALSNLNILIHPKEIQELMGYFIAKSSARSIYQKTSNYQVGKELQKEAKGDKLSITLTPKDKNSTRNMPFDTDGVLLKPLPLIQAGKVIGLQADNMHGQYLQLPITGNIANMKVELGSKTIEELKKQPYLELVSFSGLDVDTFSGNFGGEIRLGYYFDGQKIVPITGGSIAGDLEEVVNEFYFSKEAGHENGYQGPAMMLLKKINIVKGN